MIALKGNFEGKILTKVDKIIKEGDKMIVDQNHKLKIADKFSLLTLDGFLKEDFARY